MRRLPRINAPSTNPAKMDTGKSINPHELFPERAVRRGGAPDQSLGLPDPAPEVLGEDGRASEAPSEFQEAGR